MPTALPTTITSRSLCRLTLGPHVIVRHPVQEAMPRISRLRDRMQSITGTCQIEFPSGLSFATGVSGAVDRSFRAAAGLPSVFHSRSRSGTALQLYSTCRLLVPDTPNPVAEPCYLGAHGIPPCLTAAACQAACLPVASMCRRDTDQAHIISRHLILLRSYLASAVRRPKAGAMTRMERTIGPPGPSSTPRR